MSGHSLASCDLSVLALLVRPGSWIPGFHCLDLAPRWLLLLPALAFARGGAVRHPPRARRAMTHEVGVTAGPCGLCRCAWPCARGGAGKPLRASQQTRGQSLRSQSLTAPALTDTGSRTRGGRRPRPAPVWLWVWRALKRTELENTSYDIRESMVYATCGAVGKWACRLQQVHI